MAFLSNNRWWLSKGPENLGGREAKKDALLTMGYKQQRAVWVLHLSLRTSRFPKCSVTQNSSLETCVAC